MNYDHSAPVPAAAPDASGVRGRLLCLWQGVLGADALPTRSFIEVGGNSFLAVVLVAGIYDEIGVEIDYLDVLQAGSVADIAESVKLAGG